MQFGRFDQRQQDSSLIFKTVGFSRSCSCSLKSYAFNESRHHIHPAEQVPDLRDSGVAEAGYKLVYR